MHFLQPPHPLRSCPSLWQHQHPLRPLLLRGNLFRGHPFSSSITPHNHDTTDQKENPQSKAKAKRKRPQPLPPRPTLPDHSITHVALKGSGPGGQAINKTNSAIQMTHIPTGIVVKSQATRSKSQNYKIARRILAEKVELAEAEAAAKAAKEAEATEATATEATAAATAEEDEENVRENIIPREKDVLLQTRAGAVQARKRAKKKSAEKKKRRKYRRLAEEKNKGEKGEQDDGDDDDDR